MADKHTTQNAVSNENQGNENQAKSSIRGRKADRLPKVSEGPLHVVEDGIAEKLKSQEHALLEKRAAEKKTANDLMAPRRDIALEHGANLIEAARRIRNAVRDSLYIENRRTPEESRAWGKSLRKRVPRSSHAVWIAPENREDPVALLASQAKTRVPGLVPIRHERMAASPFSYYRGAALPMASDLSHTPTTGITVQACGDAHIANFGLFASPEQRIVFDINDFDETLPGPWEWDIKRLAASIEVCARERGFSEAQQSAAVRASAAEYRDAMQQFSQMGTLDVWYAHADIDWVLEHVPGAKLKEGEQAVEKQLTKTLTKARSKNSARAVKKFTEVVDGKLRIKSDPPLVVPLRDFRSAGQVGIDDVDQVTKVISHVIQGYRASLPHDRQWLIDQYRGVDMAHKVVGVGSVGLRAWIIVMEGANMSDPLVLQAKEAQASVLERYVGKSRYAEHGRRVVEGQRAMQTTSDIFLGWTRQMDASGVFADYYVRQLWNGKGSVDLATITPEGLTNLARVCGWVLAHAHARTGDRFAIAGYLGKGDTFVDAIEKFSNAYADQNEADYQRFLNARKNGLLQ